MPALIPALIVGAGAIGGAAISSAAANHAGNVAANAAAQNNALQQQTYDSNKALIQPSVDRGKAAADALNGFLGLGGDPAKTQAAFKTYLDSTGYQFNRQQGLDGAEQSKAAEGLFNSGSTLQALDQYGTGLADQYGQQYVSNLSGVANTGENAINALTGAGTNNANQQSGDNTNAASVSANAGLASAAQINGLINSAVNAFGAARGASSFGAGAASGYNPFKPGG